MIIFQFLKYQLTLRKLAGFILKSNKKKLKLKAASKVKSVIKRKKYIKQAYLKC